MVQQMKPGLPPIMPTDPKKGQVTETRCVLQEMNEKANRAMMIRSLALGR